MEKINLIRKEFYTTCTRGHLLVRDTVFYILELPWRDNLPNISCVPTGEYEVVYLPVSSSGKYKNVYLLRNVPGRGGVLIHNGNIVDHTHGCLLIGLSLTTMAGRLAIANSRTALFNFTNLLNQKNFTLQIANG